MKRKYKFSTIILGIIFTGACTYDFPEGTEPTKGSADFTKMVVVGSSLTAGFMNGALYDAGQANSFVSIIASQMQALGGGAFNQPDINAVDGYYATALNMPPIPDGTILGRLYLKGTTSPKPTPKIPGQAITDFAGDKSALNNFSAYGVSIQLSLAAATSGPSGGNPYYSRYFARFAANPSVDGVTGSSLISDASAALANGGTFFIFWLGNDDVLGYATNGADQNDATKPITSEAAFAPAYGAALTAILNANANTTGVVANIPDVTTLPYFSTVTYNAIPLDAATATAVNGGFAGYNTALDGLKNPAFTATHGLTDEQLDARKVVYAASSKNEILIQDESVVDLGDGFDALESAGAINATQRAALVPFEQVREASTNDLITLSAGSILGTLVGGNPQLVNGVTVPLADKYVLIPTEITQIQDRITAFNAVIADAVADNATRLALVDVNAILASLKTSGASINGSTLTATITPPFGGFSLDGIHPNARGNGYIANKFIEVINAKYGATIPYCNPNNFGANELPVP